MHSVCKTAERPPFNISFPSGKVLSTVKRPLIMGILNVTLDSFSDGGKFYTPVPALKQARKMIEQGADIIDVGGESTRPGSEAIDAKEEKKRVLPVIKELAAESKVVISIDTRKAVVAQAAFEVGADMLNDTSALRYDPRMAELVASSGMPVCLMHMQGQPQNMQENPAYDHVVDDIKEWLEERIKKAQKAGIELEKMIIDPGFGFGKLAGHNLEILRRLSEFHEIGRPLLIGTSRKSTIGKVLGKGLDERLYGTLATVTSSVLAGAHIFRVHDVGECKDAIIMSEAILRGERWGT